jgi:hypothetical protein
MQNNNRSDSENHTFCGFISVKVRSDVLGYAKGTIPENLLPTATLKADSVC